MKSGVTLFFLTVCYFYSSAQGITYYNHIQPILQSHCTSCHNKESVGAMPLTSYMEVMAYAKMINYVTENRIMPPWKADAGVARYHNHNPLSSEEIKTLKEWMTTGMKKGESPDFEIKKEPYKITGKADYIFAMKEPFTVNSDYTERIQTFVIPTNLKQDIFVSAVEFVPGNKKVVKSCTISVDTSGEGMRYDSYDMNYGYRSFAGINFIPWAFCWYQYTPDMSTASFNAPLIKKIPAGSKLIFQIAYAASTAVQKDSSYIKIKLAEGKPEEKIVQSEILFTVNDITNKPFIIEEDEKKFFYAAKKLERNILLYSIMPQGQYACSSWEIFAVDSITGVRTNILKISKWDAHWKKKYDFATPVILKKGVTIHGIAYYNNSEENPNLVILPPQKIKYGESPKEEMFLVQYDIAEN